MVKHRPYIIVYGLCFHDTYLKGNAMNISAVVLVVIIYLFSALGVYHSTGNALVSLFIMSPLSLLVLAFCYKGGRYLDASFRLLSAIYLIFSNLYIFWLKSFSWSTSFLLVSLVFIFFKNEISMVLIKNGGANK